MKRFIAFVICALVLLCALTIVTFAEEAGPKVTEPTITDKIVAFVQENLTDISVCATLLMTIFYNVRKHGVLNKTIGVLNSNSINIAESSTASVQNALTEVSRINETVMGYSAKMEEVLDYIKTAKLVDKELADEVASLLTLANIPNSVKDELYARHVAAVHAIEAAEHTEVTLNDGEEA